MTEPWQKHMRIGVVHFMLYPECLGGNGPFVDSLRVLSRDEFFESVDVGLMENRAQRRECAELLRDSRMIVNFACQPVLLGRGLDLNAANEAERQTAVTAVVELIEQARELGAVRFGLMSGKNVPRHERPAAVERLLESLRHICRQARDRAGLPVVLEIFDHDVDKKALIGRCELAASVAREVRRDFPDFGLLHDLSHIYLCKEEPARHLPLIREFLVGMHVGNSVSQPGHPLFGDSHPLFGIPSSDSDVPQLRNFLKVLFDIGYFRPGRRPLLSFEIRTPMGKEPQDVISHMKRTLQAAWWDW